MPRFFFHVRTAPGPVIPDVTGIEFADLAAAVADAEQGIIQTPVADFQAILITDEAGELLASVPFDRSRPSRLNVWIAGLHWLAPSCCCLQALA